MKKNHLLAVPMLLGASFAANASMVITGAYDGPLANGLPKGIEIYVTEDISDITLYGIGSANNGGGSDGEEFTFSGTSISAGSYIYVTSNIVGFSDYFGFTPEHIFETGFANVNGDDAFELFENGQVIDVFGEITIDGTNQAWEYMDGWAYRINDTEANAGIFDINDWSFSGRNAWDGEITNASASVSMPVGTFSAGSTTPPPPPPPSTAAPMTITAAFDGPLARGLPKGIEIYIGQDIADLSIYGIGSANNGGGTDGQEFTFPSIAVSAGSYIYVTSNIAGFDTYFGFTPGVIFETGVATINGDDAVELFENGQVIDVFGEVNVDGTNQPWEYLDGWAYRINNTDPNGGTFAINDWSFSGRNAWDGETSNATAAFPLPIGTFTSTGGSTTPPVAIGACFDPATLISSVQGSGATVTGTADVVVEGIVTGIRGTGFFLQEEPSDSDNNANTSEGIFVVGTPVSGLTVGDVARISGTPSEFFANSQLTLIEQLDCGVAAETILPVFIPVPFEGIFDLETVEGMVASVSNATIFSLDNFTRFGEMFLSDSVKRTPSDVAVPLSPEYDAAVTNLTANIILIEDNNGLTFPAEISYYSTPTFNGLNYDNAPRVGDSVSATGPVQFAFGNYRINPTQSTFSINSTRTLAPEIVAGDVSIASFNVLNYFNGEVTSNGVTFDFPENRGAANAEEFALQQARIIEALVTIDSDVVGLIEIENDGFGNDSAIKQLVDELNARLGATIYDYAQSNDTSITGTDAISNAVIYKPAVVTPVGALAGIPLPTQENGNRTVRQRNSLVQTFTHNATGDQFAVVVNHFKSKGSTCFEDDNSPTELDLIQGSCGAFRVSTAIELGNSLAAMNLPEKLLILGDLNTYSQEDALAILTDYDPATRGYTITTAVNTELDNGNSVPVTNTFGYQSVASAFDPNNFSFYFFGDDQVGSLDHILASPAAFNSVVDLTHWNINSIELFELTYDRALAFYNPANGDLIDFTTVGPYRSSDHDPVIVTLQLGTQN
ncbi:ExeM/NucH family extracellular endonuclease [Sessilibacter corallicola]|uniref:ExeM/NucH family extracellular endonuclease n=1 Tax=Sessilibacter corallicola TaxID=2904075 RepID=UPI001E582D7C|nr:ExeM/NucH family extracellular endonuclease [Sessilibacter corallicola]MCE2029321.1 ExeM/NucH family extracellular endonuclease [Sessilibacter corallicola]